MPLNFVKKNSNMYSWIDATWNTVKGKCPHDCSYCYMKRFPQKELHFDEKELKTDLGRGNKIFVGSSCDMWADLIPEDWIFKTLEHCSKFDNEYIFQTKYPYGMYAHTCYLPKKHTLGTTIETDRVFKIMGNAVEPIIRTVAMKELSLSEHRTFITIEPIMDFNIERFIEIIKICHPSFVNIGADTGNNHLPEPPKEKILELIGELKKFTVVNLKKNLDRLLEGK